jgi:hypothetical protein
MTHAPSQRTQIIRHFADLSQHSRILEIAGRRITSAAERDRTGMSATWDELKLKLDEWYPRFDDTMQLPFSSGVYALPSPPKALTND